MTQIVAVLTHKQADRLGPEWQSGRCNAYTRTMVRLCGSEEELQLVARTLPRGTVWAVESAAA